MALVDIDLQTWFDLSEINTRHAHGRVVHIQLVKGAVPNDDGSLITDLMNAGFVHLAMPELVIAPDKQRFLGGLTVMQGLHAHIKCGRVRDRLNIAPRQLPAHGSNELHGQQYPCHAWVKVRVIKARANDFVRKLFVDRKLLAF